MREFNNNISYTQLITFKAIYEAGNISKAAKQLGISAASVSYSLKSLEKQLTQPLFVRSTRAIKPTDIGMQLYESTRYAVEELTGAVERICDLGDTPTGKLSLNMAEGFYQHLLKPIIQDFAKAYPHIQLEITLSNGFDKHTENTIDVGFRVGEAVEETMVARSINHLFAPMKMAVFVSADYAKAHGVAQSLAELAQHPQIKFRLPTSQHLAPIRLHKTALTFSDTQSTNASEIIALELPTAMVVNNADVLIDMVAQGFGVGSLLDTLVQERFDSGEFIPVLSAHWRDVPPLYMYYTQDNKQSRKVRCFVDFVSGWESRQP